MIAGGWVAGHVWSQCDYRIICPWWLAVARKLSEPSPDSGSRRYPSLWQYWPCRKGKYIFNNFSAMFPWNVVIFSYLFSSFSVLCSDKNWPHKWHKQMSDIHKSLFVTSAVSLDDGGDLRLRHPSCKELKAARPRCYSIQRMSWKDKTKRGSFSTTHCHSLSSTHNRSACEFCVLMSFWREVFSS